MRVSMNDPKQVLKRADVKAMFKMDPVKVRAVRVLLLRDICVLKK